LLCIIPIIKKRHLENNIELFGMIPNINYKNNNLYEIECDFSDTNLCYSKNDINSKCIYPKTYYECSDCKENSEVKNKMCECNEGYTSIGYMNCFKGDYRECEYINNLFDMEETYNCCMKSGITCSNNHIIKLYILLY